MPAVRVLFLQALPPVGVALLGVALLGVALLGVALLGVALLGVALLGMGPSAAAGPTYKPFPPVRAPRSFVAVRLLTTQPASSGVTVDSATTGSLEDVVLADPWEGLVVNATAVDHAGRVWVSLSSGPRCATPALATCHPVPGSCSSAVVRIDPATGDPERLLDGSDDELIEDARPSPNARFLASVVATCTSSGRDQYLRVTDMATHRSWTIGRHLGACQTFSSLAW